MILRSTLIVLALASSGCASLNASDPPSCDGSPRRPANPHGSVLAPDPAPVMPASPKTNGWEGGCP